jgi:hypothetical protein
MARFWLRVLYLRFVFRVGHEKLVNDLARVGPVWIGEDAPGSTTGRVRLFKGCDLALILA